METQMKILCNKFSNALYHIFNGWKEVFIRTGHEWKWLTEKNVVDTFKTYKPDMYIGSTYELNEEFIYALNDTDVITLLKGNNYGDLEIDSKKFPIGIADDKEITFASKLKRVDGIFNFYHKNRYPGTMNKWQDSLGIKLLEGLPAADTFNHYVSPKDDNLLCDIGFVGGYWKYKAEEINRYLLPLCYKPGRFNIKIFGNQPWPVPQYMGLCSGHTANKLFSSATVCPNISEPHAGTFGFEVNERFFKLAACKAFQISPRLASAEEDIFKNGEVVFVDTPEDFEDAVNNFIINPQLREPFIEEAYKTVMNNHTYIHRIKNIWSDLNMTEEVNKCQHLLEQTLEKK